MMRVEDRDESQIFALQILKHGPGVSRINNRGVASIANRPDVVIGERPQRNDFECFHLPNLRINCDSSDRSFAAAGTEFRSESHPAISTLDRPRKAARFRAGKMPFMGII
jgi:hypothetical protein